MKCLVQGYCSLYQYHYLKYLTVEIIYNKHTIEGSEAAADDRLLRNWPPILLTQLMLDIGSGIKSAQKRRGKIKCTQINSEH